MIIRLFIILAVLLLPLQSQAYTLQECNAACAQLFPGGPVIPPVTPPVVPPATKVCAMPITFEARADQNDQKAAVLFRTLQDSQVIAVSVNGEVARRGRPYKGCPVFLLENEGGQYQRPLKIVAQTSDGQTCVAVSGTSETPAGPTNPTGGYKNQATYKAYGKRNGGRWAWRITKRGDSLGPGPVRFTFYPSGKTFTVKSTAKNCRDREDTCRRDTSAPMDGFLFKPGNGRPNGEGDDDIGTAHGGIYLHAIYGDDSPTVKMEW